MATVDPAEEWRRLSVLYAEMVDGELLDLKDAFGDLTEVAQDVLQRELKKRHLWDLPIPAAAPEPDVRERPRASLEDLRLGGVIVGEYESVKEANLAEHVLELAGIQATMVEGHGKFDVRPPSVCVAPEDAEKASAVLAQPISAETRAEYEATLNMPDFEVPACPHCSCGEVLLEAFEPNNQWLCEECGHQWEDAAPPSEVGKENGQP